MLFILTSSGSLRLLLNRLSILCAVDHRKPAKFDVKKKVKEATPKPKILQKNTDNRQVFILLYTQLTFRNIGLKELDLEQVKTTRYPSRGLPRIIQSNRRLKLKIRKHYSWYSIIYVVIYLLKGVNAFLSLEGALPEPVIELLADSCLIPALEGYLRNDSVLEMARFKSVHIAALTLVTYKFH